jgi:hypothetical protein
MRFGDGRARRPQALNPRQAGPFTPRASQGGTATPPCEESPHRQRTAARPSPGLTEVMHRRGHARACTCNRGMESTRTIPLCLSCHPSCFGQLPLASSTLRLLRAAHRPAGCSQWRSGAARPHRRPAATPQVTGTPIEGYVSCRSARSTAASSVWPDARAARA